MMDSNMEDERPLKRVRTDSIAGALGVSGLATFRPATKDACSAYQEAEAALDKLTLIDRDQAVHLLKTHPEVSKLLRVANPQGAPASNEAATIAKVEAAMQDLRQEKDDLETAIHEEMDAHDKDKQALEKKIKSSTVLCTKLLQQNVAKLENSLRDLRKNVFTRATFETKRLKDDEIARLHGLVGTFADKILREFQTSLSVASTMLGSQVPPPANAPAQTIGSLREETAFEQSAHAAEPEQSEDEFMEDEHSECEEQAITPKQSTKNNKLYDTEYVESHPNENFFHRASGRWMKGLPDLEAASVFTGVRGPGAVKWKAMKEKHEANKPKKKVTAEKRATPKKNEQSAVKAERSEVVKVEHMMPGLDKAQAIASARKIQQLELTVSDLQFKLKELRSKLEEEVRARRKAEAELGSVRALWKTGKQRSV